MNELNFITKTSNHGKQLNSSCDLAITMQNAKHVKEADSKNFGFSFSLRADKILGVPEAIAIAVSGSRMYFKSCDSREGYVINRISSKNRVYCSYPTRGVSGFARWCGDYKINYDSTHNMFYIEMSTAKR